MKDMRRLFGYTRPYRGRLFLALGAMVVATGLNLLLPLAVRAMIDSVLARQDAALLNQVALALVGLFLIRALFGMVEGYNLSIVTERMVADLRQQLYAHTVRLSLRFFADQRMGEITSRVNNDISTMQGVVTGTLAVLLEALITIVGALVIALQLNWRLTTLMLAIVPVAAIISRLYGRYVRRLSREVQDRLADSTSVLEETLSGIRIVQSFAREPFEIGRYNDSVWAIFEASRRKALISAFFSPLVGTLFTGAIAAIFWLGGREVLAGRLSAGELIAFIFYSLTIAGAVSSLANSYNQVQRGLGASERIFELLETAPEIADPPHPVTLTSLRGAVAFENVSFGYLGDGLPTLRNISLRAEPGEVIALVGPSGGGKSTLVNLIPRFYDVSEGRITVDGHDVRAVGLESLRQAIAIVPQETQLFGSSVLDNIRYGKLDADESEIEAAARAAHAHDWIVRLPQGYDTLVGEKGVKLSGGQRQRVAIARAILKDPAILLLDEATSALDSESEGIVQRALDELMQGRTVFVIAHRLSTIRRANRILVLDGGQIVEQGTHEALIALGGLYQRLHTLQFRDDQPVSHAAIV